MMKGLLYKEFYLTRKTYLGFLGLAIGISLLCILVCISMICGNLQSVPTESPEDVESYFQIFIYAPFVLLLFASDACEHSIYADYASGWMKYSYTLPTPVTKAIGVRYLTGVIIVGVCIVFGFINAEIMSMILNKPITAEIVKNLLGIALIGLSVNFIFIPLALRYKTAQAVGNKAGIVFIVSYIAIGAYFINNMGQMSDAMKDQYIADMMAKVAEIRDILLPLSPVIMLILFVVSFSLAVKLYQWREK